MLAALPVVLSLLPLPVPAAPNPPPTDIVTNTFSIVVGDPRSREVAVAGASCVPDASIIASLVRNIGAAATQAAFSSTNKTRVEQRLVAGDTPQQVIAFVTASTRDSGFARRQYGVMTLAGGSAGFTGSQTSPANGHRTGPFIAVQGNLLEQTAVLDSILATYVDRPDSPLVSRVLLALEAGQAAGGDARCLHGADSSFIKIQRAEDTGLFANLVVTNPSSGQNPNDPIAQLRRSVDTWRAQRAGQVDRWNSTVTVFPARIPADGSALSTLTVTLRDPGGSVLPGRAVSAAGQGIGSVSAFTDRGNGVYTATARSSSLATETFTVQSGGVSLSERPRVSYVTPPGFRQALLVVGSTTLGAGDAALADLLRQLGFDVVVDTAPATTPADASGRDLVVVSSTINASDLGARLNGVPQPILNLEPLVGDDMGLSGTASTNFGTVANQRQAAVRTSSIASGVGVAPGLRLLLSQPEEIGFSIPATSAEVVATTTTSTTRAFAYVYDTGDRLANGATAPGPRGFLGLRNLTARSFNGTGRSLFEAMVRRLAP